MPDETPAPPASLLEDPILSALAEDLPKLLEAEKKKKEPPTAPEIKPVAEPAAPDPAVAAEPPKVPVGVKKREDARAIAEEVVTRRLREQPTALPTPLPVVPVTAPEPKPAAYDETLLVPEQKEELEDARFAEKIDPKNKGRAEQLLSYYKKVDDWVEAKQKEDPEAVFDAQNEDLKEFIAKNRPKWADAERDTIRRRRFIDEAKTLASDEMKKEMEPKMKKLEQDALEAKMGPRIEKKMVGFREELEKETKTDDPLEKDVFGRFSQAAEELATDFVRLMHGVDTFGEHNSPERNQRHNWITGFVAQQGEIFNKNGGDARVRDGKTFVTPARLAEMVTAKDPKLSNVWTFGEDDVLKMIRSHAIHTAKNQVTIEEEQAKKRGFVRQKPSHTPKPAEDPKPSTGIKASATAAPGAALDPKENEHFGHELISVLGLRD